MAKKTPAQMVELKKERIKAFKEACVKENIDAFEKAPAVFHLILNEIDNEKLLIYPSTLKFHVSTKGGFVLKDLIHCLSTKELVSKIKDVLKRYEE
jgi:hypothetical protein